MIKINANKLTNIITDSIDEVSNPRTPWLDDTTLLGEMNGVQIHLKVTSEEDNFIDKSPNESNAVVEFINDDEYIEFNIRDVDCKLQNGITYNCIGLHGEHFEAKFLSTDYVIGWCEITCGTWIHVHKYKPIG